MAKYNIQKTNADNSKLKGYYEEAKKEFSFQNDDLDIIFNTLLDNKGLFPNINLKKQDEQAYLKAWVKEYNDGITNLTSKKAATAKSACSDPALRLIVSTACNHDNDTISSEQTAHNLFMSAENVQGELLEEYIASKIRCYGFIWAAGTVMQSIDFCSTDGTVLLQIKNKNNTENSSSSKVREGTTIEKWYRLSTVKDKKTKNPVPKYHWEKLNTIINSYDYPEKMPDLPPCEMSEEDYNRFLKDVCKKNHNIITGE